MKNELRYHIWSQNNRWNQAQLIIDHLWPFDDFCGRRPPPKVTPPLKSHLIRIIKDLSIASNYFSFTHNIAQTYSSYIYNRRHHSLNFRSLLNYLCTSSRVKIVRPGRTISYGIWHFQFLPKMTEPARADGSDISSWGTRCTFSKIWKLNIL